MQDNNRRICIYLKQYIFEMKSRPRQTSEHSQVGTQQCTHKCPLCLHYKRLACQRNNEIYCFCLIVQSYHYLISASLERWYNTLRYDTLQPTALIKMPRVIISTLYYSNTYWGTMLRLYDEGQNGKSIEKRMVLSGNMENCSHKNKYSKTSSGKLLYWKYNTVQISRWYP